MSIELVKKAIDYADEEQHEGEGYMLIVTLTSGREIAGEVGGSPYIGRNIFRLEVPQHGGLEPMFIDADSIVTARVVFT